MNKKTKKGFTLVELLVVIAILAILATVSVVGYTSFINKANISADGQAVKQFNTVLEAEAALGNKPGTIGEVKNILNESDVNVDGGLIPVTKGYAFFWNPNDNKVVLVGGEVVAEDGWQILSGNTYGEQVNADTADKLVEALSSDKAVHVTLTSDMALSAMTLADNKVASLDLNGKTLTIGAPLAKATSDNGLVVTNGATLSIKNGTIIDTTSTNTTIYNQGGNVTLDGVTIESNAIGTIGVIGVSDTSILNCTITAKGNGAYYGITSNSSDVAHDGARLSIINTTVSTVGAGGKDNAAVVLNVVGNIVIDSCTFTGDKQGLVLRGTTAVVKNTTIESTCQYGGSTADYDDQGNNVPMAGVTLHAGGEYEANGNYAFENVTVKVPEGKTVLAAGTTGDYTVDVIWVGATALTTANMDIAANAATNSTGNVIVR